MGASAVRQEGVGGEEEEGASSKGCDGSERAQTNEEQQKEGGGRRVEVGVGEGEGKGGGGGEVGNGEAERVSEEVLPGRHLPHFEEWMDARAQPHAPSISAAMGAAPITEERDPSGGEGGEEEEAGGGASVQHQRPVSWAERARERPLLVELAHDDVLPFIKALRAFRYRVKPTFTCFTSTAAQNLTRTRGLPGALRERVQRHARTLPNGNDRLSKPP